MSDPATSPMPPPSFDEAKVRRIVDEIRLIMDVENPTAGEACAALSFGFKVMIDSSPTEAERDGTREACVNAIRQAGA